MSTLREGYNVLNVVKVYWFFNYLRNLQCFDHFLDIDWVRITVVQCACARSVTGMPCSLRFRFGAEKSVTITGLPWLLLRCPGLQWCSIVPRISFYLPFVGCRFVYLSAFRRLCQNKRSSRPHLSCCIVYYRYAQLIYCNYSSFTSNARVIEQNFRQIANVLDRKSVV